MENWEDYGRRCWVGTEEMGELEKKKNWKSGRKRNTWVEKRTREAEGRYYSGRTRG